MTFCLFLNFLYLSAFSHGNNVHSNNTGVEILRLCKLLWRSKQEFPCGTYICCFFGCTTTLQKILL